MPNWFICMCISICCLIPTTDADSADDGFGVVSTPLIAGADAGDAMNHLFDLDPLVYIIVSGLLAAIVSLTYTLKVVWGQYQLVVEEKDILNESKVKIAMASTETLTEAMATVKYINDGVIKLNESEGNRKVVDTEIKNQLVNINKVLDTVTKELEDIRREFK